MQNNIKQQAVAYALKRRRKQRWHQVVTCLAAIVVFCTTYALILPAITLENGSLLGQAQTVSAGDVVQSDVQAVSAGDAAYLVVGSDLATWLAQIRGSGAEALLMQVSKGEIAYWLAQVSDGDATAWSQQSVSSGDAVTILTLAKSWLPEEEYAQVAHIVALIEELPTADEADEKLLAYEGVEDWEEYENYFTDVGYRGRRIYDAYLELSEVQQVFVYNFDKLMELSYIWSAVTLIDEITSDVPTTVKAASTSDFIELNLYDYGSNINEKYTSDNKYPGFQWNGGAYVNGTYNRHKVDFIDFGNSRITDFTYGSSSSGTQGKSTNAQLIGRSDGSNGAINKLDVSSFGVTNRPIGMSLNSTITDTTEDVLSRVLGEDGYPVLKDGITSLSYLFKNGTYATKQNTESIEGLFQLNEVTGEYFYNSRENHAQYSNNNFTLHDQIITPNFIVYPFGNFLPLNDITSGSNATQVGKITSIGKYVQEVINDLIYASDYSSNATKRQLVDMLAMYRNDLQGGDYTTNTGDPWATWNAKNAIVDYFTTGSGDNPSDDTSPITNALLNKMYNIDWDVETNFFFGMDMKMTFMQPKGGMTGNDTNQDGESDYPMVFYFTGDDDVWVYIDDVLFLDLSGIHRHVGGKIDFVEGKVHYYYLDTANTGDVSETPYQTYTFKEILEAAGKSAAGLNGSGTFKDYTYHTFKFYYMERGSGSSVCRLNFNFPLLKRNTISISKELTVDEQDKLELLGNPNFKFQILKADSSGNQKQELFIGAGVKYTIYDKTDTKVGEGVTDANGVFTLKAGQRAEFTDIKEDAGKYYVRELLDPAAFTQYGIITVDGHSTTTNYDVTVGTDVFTGVNSPVKDASDGSTGFSFNNQIVFNKLGSLKIGKELETYSQTRSVPEFTFTVTLDGQLLPAGTIYTVDNVSKTVETEGIVIVPAGSAAKIENIIAGTEFTVQETESSSKGYTVTYSGSEGVTTDGGKALGTIVVDSTVNVTVTNSENGISIPIPIKKTVTNPDGTDRTFTFTLTQVTDSTGQIPMDGGTSQTAKIKLTGAGESTFTLQYLQKDMDTLPKNFYYRITEDADEDQKQQIYYDASVYVVEVTVIEDLSVSNGLSTSITSIYKDGIQIAGSSVTGVSGTDAEIIFTNTLLGDLSVRKKVSGGATDQQFSFNLKLETGMSGLATLPTSYTLILNHADGKQETKEVTFTDGMLQFTMGHGESLVIQGIPQNAVWTLEETAAAGYHTSWKAEGGTLQAAIEQGSNTFSGSITSGEIAVTCTNATTYVLPDTGGTGSYMYTAGGMLLIMMACSLLLLINKKIILKRKGINTMKRMKKIASLMLVLVMVLAMNFNVFAEETGSITINDAVVDQTYTIYQILDLESYNATTGAYSYKAAAAWEAFVKSTEIAGVYLQTDGQGYVTWLDGADAATFAKAAQAYAKDNTIAPSADPIKATATTVKFEGLDLGYYLVDTTLGTLCSLDTTNPDVVMEEKNEAPTVEKEVQEDSNNAWGATNDADIDQTVNFKATITVQKGAENYILHDTMSAGLTYKGVTSITIKNVAVDTAKYEVISSCTDGCTFEVKFDNNYIATLAAGTEIVVAYSAVLNENAVIGMVGNPNEVKLQYGDENQPSYTPVDKTITYTWDMNVVKYALDKDQNEIKLEGAIFTLSKNANGTDPIKFTETADNIYEVDANGTVTEITTDSTGTFKIEGLDADTYYMTEIAAPAGYNKLAAPITVVISSTSADEGETLTYTMAEAKVLNNAGTELPSTGGIGTTIFYAAGGILVLVAIVLLITRRRMSMEK